MAEITIDINVLKVAIDEYNSERYNAVNTLCCIERKHTICFDTEDIIRIQYEDVVWKDGFLSSWYSLIIKRGNIMKYSSKLCKRHKRRLNVIGYDKDDEIFISVAHKSKDKILLSNDGDYYKKQVSTYLRNEMGIICLTTSDCDKIA